MCQILRASPDWSQVRSSAVAHTVQSWLMRGRGVCVKKRVCYSRLTSVRAAVLRLTEAHDLLHAILGVLHQLPPPDLRAPLSGRARALALLTHLHRADICVILLQLWLIIIRPQILFVSVWEWVCSYWRGGVSRSIMTSRTARLLWMTNAFQNKSQSSRNFYFVFKTTKFTKRLWLNSGK